jgi:hypothetical protein
VETLVKAAHDQAALDPVVEAAVKSWPLDPMLVNLTGYHLKNAYMIKFWDAIQAWRARRVIRSSTSRRSDFLETLALDPDRLRGRSTASGKSCSSSATSTPPKFFHRAAIVQASRRDIAYHEAEQDLALVRRFKGGDDGSG